jgi:lipopolysaccharide transport system permease protein
MNSYIIKTGSKIPSLNFKEIYNYRDLLMILAYRDFKVRYAKTFLGVAWALIQPLFTLLVFTLIFHQAAGIKTGNIPYPLYVLSGLSAWSYFAYVMGQAGNSIIGAQGLIQKVYFPRMIIPLSKAFVGLIDMGIVMVFLFIIMIYYQFPLSLNIIFLPFFVFANILLALGVGIWLSAMTVRFRDFQLVIPFLLQFGMYASPIAYPQSLIPEKYLSLLYLNPTTAIVQGYRWCLLGGNAPDYRLALSIAVIILIFVSSLYYFKRTERTMVDII